MNGSKRAAAGRLLAVLGLVFGLVFAAGCVRVRTELRVELCTDLVQGVDFDTIEVSAQWAATRMYANSTNVTVTMPSPDAGLSFGLSVDPRDPAALATVTVTALLGRNVVASQRAVTGFAPGESRIVVLDLLRRCRGVTCPGTQTCAASGCRTNRIDASELLERMQFSRSTHCQPFRADCNGSVADGRETNLLTSTMHCGACGHVCASGSCLQGVCENETTESVVCGSEHTCLRRRSGEVACFGSGAFGQLANARSGSDYFETVSVAVAGPERAASVGAGARHTCLVNAADGVFCAGDNGFSQLGDGTQIMRDTPTRTAIAAGATVRAVAGGERHGCALSESGQVYCWGSNAEGQLGIGTTPPRASPVLVDMVAQAIAVTAGRAHSCAVLTAGGVLCWGIGTSGELGNGAMTNRDRPVMVSGADGVRTIAAGSSHTCAVRSDGSLLCWGDNRSGQLGDGTTQTRSVPVRVAVPGIVVQVAGGDAHTCARTQNGEVYCWGAGMFGQIGDAMTTSRTLPTRVVGLAPASWVAAGGGHSCAVSAMGITSCWGRNGRGQLGIGSMSDQSAPVRVVGR